MPVQLLAVMPFGFVFELENDGCHYAPARYEVWINRVFHCAAGENVVSVFGLAPDTCYLVELKGLDEKILFTVQTQRAGYVLDVRHYNAAGDGKEDDTSAVNAAIYTAPPGSVVVFPKGEYLLSQVLLKSGVDLYLEEGAVLRQNPHRAGLAILRGYQKDYLHRDAVVNASWEGHPLDCYCSLLYGKGVQNVRIYGKGALDGSGSQGGWWENPSGEAAAYRPRNLFLVECSDILVAGITSRNSAAWNIHPFYSSRMRFYDLHIQSAADSPNTDGLNPESCVDVEIAGCTFDVGDDCIAVKSGKHFMAQRHFRRARNIRVRNCLMQNGHGGVVIGSEIACGVEDVSVTQCLFQHTDRGLRIKTRRGRGSGSVVRGIRFAHNLMDGVKHCLAINMFYHCDPDGHSGYVQSKEALPLDEGTPKVEDVVFSHTDCTNISGCAVFAYGLPEQPVGNVTVHHCGFSFGGNTGEPPVMMDKLEPLPGVGIYLKHVRQFSFTGTTCDGVPVKPEGAKEGVLWRR